MREVRIICGDCDKILKNLPENFVNCVVTSPPYWGLRNYGVEGQLGLEKTYEEYVAKLVQIFEQVRRVLRDDGTLWLNLGDSYASRSYNNPDGEFDSLGQNCKTAGLKPKDLVGIPWKVAFALRDAGWYLRQDIIWAKPNPMPESVKDRCTRSHEYLFLLTKSDRYYYDATATREDCSKNSHGSPRINPGKKAEILGHGKGGSLGKWTAEQKQQGRNKRSVWTVATSSYRDAHFATFPPDLVEPCIKAGCSEGGIVLDPFGGAGTVGLVAARLGRDAILVEINEKYCEMAKNRILKDAPLLNRAGIEK